MTEHLCYWDLPPNRGGRRSLGLREILGMIPLLINLMKVFIYLKSFQPSVLQSRDLRNVI